MCVHFHRIAVFSRTRSMCHSWHHDLLNCLCLENMHAIDPFILRVSHLQRLMGVYPMKGRARGSNFGSLIIMVELRQSIYLLRPQPENERVA